VLGFVIDNKGAPGVASQSDYDESTEYAVLKKASNREVLHELEDLGPDDVTVVGPDCFEAVDAYPLGPEWQARFDAMLEPRTGEPDLTPALLSQRTGDEDTTIVVAGGAVRDVLLGLPRRVGDLDLAGTLLPQAFRKLVDGLERARSDPERLMRRLSLPPAKRATVVKVVKEDERLALEYAPLVVGYYPPPFSGERTALFGTSFAANSSWRDLSCNSLLYGVDRDGRGVIYDPSGDGLGDIGLTPKGLRGSPEDARRRELCLSPIDIPEGMPDEMLIERIVRLLKLLPRFASDGADLAQVGEWSRRHQDRLRRAIVQKEPPSDRQADHPLTGTLRNGLGDAEIEQLCAHRAEYEEWLGSELWTIVWPLVPEHRPVRGLADRRTPSLHPRTRAFAPLVKVAGQWRVEYYDIEAPPDTTPRGLRRYLGNRFGGYGHTAASVLWDGRETIEILALAPPRGEGTWYVELDGAGRLIVVDEQELEAFRRAEQPPRA
jgi:hypothetical protein